MTQIWYNMQTIINWRLPIRLVSEANNTDHWTKKRKRFRAQHDWINMRYRLDNSPEIPESCIIVLTRIAPRELDDDNLRSSFKHCRDYIADLIRPNLAPGRADDTKLIEWNYKQEKGEPKEYAVKIEVFVAD